MTHINMTPVLVSADGTSFVLERMGMHTIGSAPDCSIVINDPDVPPQIAAVIVMPGSVMIRAAAEGVRVNDAPLHGSVFLKEGDVCTLGSLVVTLAFEPPAKTTSGTFNHPADHDFGLPESDFEEKSPLVIPKEQPHFRGTTSNNWLDPDLDPDLPPKPPKRIVSLPVEDLSDASSGAAPIQLEDGYVSRDDAIHDEVITEQPRGTDEEFDAPKIDKDEPGAPEHPFSDYLDDDADWESLRESDDDTMRGGDSLKPASSVSTQKPADSVDDVHFTAYYPREAAAGAESGMVVYAHVSEFASDIEQDIQQFVEKLGGSVPRPRASKNAVQIRKGTPVTVRVECADLAIEPLEQTKRWNSEYVRYEFSFKPTADQVGEAVVAHITILIEGIEIAAIKGCAIEIVRGSQAATVRAPGAQVIGANPLAQAKQALTKKSAEVHKRIFISYSVKDRQVAEAYRFAQIALNNDVFMDYYSLRAGQNWRAALAEAIDSADVFQLFWSKNSAASDHVRDEWQYALEYRCAGTDGSDYILPVYWVEPLPILPPQELAHLHFRYVQFSLGEPSE